MEEPVSKWKWLDRVKSVAEILALCLAGLWAIKLYRETAVPAQEKRADLNGKLEWSGITKDTCLAEYTVTFKNIGTTSIDLSEPELNVWITEEPKTSAVAKYLDPHELAKGE